MIQCGRYQINVYFLIEISSALRVPVGIGKYASGILFNLPQQAKTFKEPHHYCTDNPLGQQHNRVFYNACPFTGMEI